MTHSRHVMPINQSPPPVRPYLLPLTSSPIVIIFSPSLFHHEVFRSADSLCTAGQCLCGGSQAQAQQTPSGGDYGKEPILLPQHHVELGVLTAHLRTSTTSAITRKLSARSIWVTVLIARRTLSRIPLSSPPPDTMFWWITS